MIDLHFLDEADPHPVEFAVDGLIPMIGLTILAGAPEAGKSMLGAELAAVIVRGGFWGGRHVEPLGSVLYIAPERGAVQTRRLQNILGRDGRVAVAPGSINLRDLGAMKAIEMAAAELTKRSGLALGMIIVDTLAAATAGLRENEVAEVQPIMTGLARLSELLDAPIVIIHHLGKDGELRGSSALSGAVDAILVVKASKDGSRKLVPEKLNDGEKAGAVSFRIEAIEGVPRVVWQAGKAGPAEALPEEKVHLTPDEEALWAAIQQVRMEVRIASRDDVRLEFNKRLGSRSAPAKKTALSNGLKSLVAKGLINADDEVVRVRKGSNPNHPNHANRDAVEVRLGTPLLKKGVQPLTNTPKRKVQGRKVSAKTSTGSVQ